jgi:hypothetical protein
MTLTDQIAQTLGLHASRTASPWEHVQSYEEYEDYDAWLDDADSLGVLLRLTLNTRHRSAYLHVRVIDEYGIDYAVGNTSIALPWNIAVRMSGYGDGEET